MGSTTSLHVMYHFLLEIVFHNIMCCSILNKLTVCSPAWTMNVRFVLREQIGNVRIKALTKIMLV